MTQKFLIIPSANLDGNGQPNNLTGAILDDASVAGLTASTGYRAFALNNFDDFTTTAAGGGGLTATYVSGQNSALTPNYGTLAAGWYVFCVMARAHSITSITPPGQSAITTPRVIAETPNATSNDNGVAIYIVQLTAERSGNWTITVSGNTATASALYSLSGEPAAAHSGSTATFIKDGGSALPATFSLDVNTAAGDVLIGVLHNLNSSTMTDDGTDLVTRNFYGDATSGHRPAAFSGVATGGSPETGVFKGTSTNFERTVAAVCALRAV
jgi:hypothetical protein